MKRRSVLQSFLSVPAAVAVAQDVKPANPETPKTPATDAEAASDPVVKTFNPTQFAALRRLGEIIVPASQDTPGAKEAGAAEFLDFLIGVSPAERVTLYKAGLDRLNSEAMKRYKKPFGEISAGQAEPILAPLNAAWSYRAPADPLAKFLRSAKSDLLEATGNSREYIAAVSKRRRSAGGAGQYWYPSE
jgi:hypothetical protein